jgi:DNA-binding MarR family transcriptional regulator
MQFAILTAIAKLQPIAMSRVGEILVIEPATMTRSLRLLEKDGLIEIAPRGRRRQRLLTLTLKAEKALAVAVPLWREAQSRFLSSLGRHWAELQDELEHAAEVAVSLENADSAGDTGEAREAGKAGKAARGGRSAANARPRKPG